MKRKASGREWNVWKLPQTSHNTQSGCLKCLAQWLRWKGEKTLDNPRGQSPERALQIAIKQICRRAVIRDKLSIPVAVNEILSSLVYGGRKLEVSFKVITERQKLSIV